MKSTYKKRRQQLQLEIAAAKAGTLSIPQQIRSLETQLRILECERLRESANRYGLDLIASAPVGPWVHDPENDVQYLSTAEQLALAERAIEDARYEYWKKWVDLISPVASVVISLLAFALAAVALYLQLSGKFR